jgi:protein involved in polysaccharide export with SLBB domain
MSMTPYLSFVETSRRTGNPDLVRYRRVISCAALLILFSLSISSSAQFAAPPTTTSTDSESSTRDNQDSSSVFSTDTRASGSMSTDSISSMGAGPASNTSLSSDQIISILQQNPDLVLELKSQAVDRLQEQGKQVDVSSISDQMLYDQISSNPTTRANVTTFLRAQGYVADDGLSSAISPGGSTSSGDTLSSSHGAFDNAIDVGQRGDLNDRTQSAGPNTARKSEEKTSVDREQSAGTLTDSSKVLRRHAPYPLSSMRDLYTQIPSHNQTLNRFGSDVFVSRSGIGTASTTPLDVPLGPSYVLGPGDSLKIDVWGSITTSLSRIVDRDGRVLLPEAGSINIGGLTLGEAQSLLQKALKQQYRNAEATVTVVHPRSVRIYIVGDVQSPGGYDISSLATPLSALLAAGGPTSVGSLRTLRHYRGKQLLEEIDLYDFLLHGVRDRFALFESGDSLLVPPVGPQVAIAGAIKRPAIYEMKPGETSLEAIVANAGGFKISASLGHITIERIDANHARETVTLNIPAGQSSEADRSAIADFQVKDGDRIRIEPILPYSERAIYLEGHVVRPGRFSYTDGMRLTDVLHNYRDMLPEPAAHGEIIRLVPPDLHAETIEFNVPDVMVGNSNLNLQPFDTVRVFGRYEVDAPKVTVHGEVLRPGTYPLSKDMTAAQLVRMAGGFKRDALTEVADLTSHDISNEGKAVGSLSTVRIGAAVAATDPTADIHLKPGDILTIHQVTGWNDIGQSIKIQGQVRFPGSYGFQEGEHLSSVLRRAGGLLPTAYPSGAVLIRQQVKELEEKSRAELIRQIESNSAAARISPGAVGGSSGSTLQLIKAQQDQVLSDLKNHPATGRMVIHISFDIDSWANTPMDIEVRRGDILTVPKQPGFVLVEGQVYNATALTFTPGKTAEWYLSHAGGTNAAANRKEVFIIRANGSVIGRHSGGWFDPSVLSTRLNPGDVVVVPQKIIGASVFWRNLLSTGQLAASVAITAGVAAAAL